MRRELQLFLSAVALFAACDDPKIEEYVPHTGLITGTIIYQQPPQPVMPSACQAAINSDFKGDVVLTLFRSDALPPPQGSSGPVNFIVVSEETLFTGDPQNGIYTAPFTMPTVPEGTYQIRAFVDSDEDFHPTIDLLAQTTAGDVGGGYVDIETGRFLDIDVKTDEITSHITVSIGRTIPVERPVFAHTSTTTFKVPFATPQPLLLGTHALSRGRINANESCNKFLISYADLDEDGVPDDANGDHLPDLFPRVLLRLEKTETQTRDIIIPAIIDPLAYRDILNVVPAFPVDEVALLLPPVAVDITGGGQEILPAIPAGRYETIVIAVTGQTWQVPNGLDRFIADGGPDPTQSVWVTMEAGPAAPVGGISGTVRVGTEQEGDVFVVVFDAANPPPPAGTGGPLGLATLPASSFSSLGAMREAPFKVSGLADGQYIVSALLDVDGSFSAISSILSQPSAGDFVGQAALPVAVSGAVTDGVQVLINQEIAFDRPAFSFEPGLSFSRAAFPVKMVITAQPVPALGIDEMSAAVPIVLSVGDQEGDNYRDFLPRVLLTKMLDEGDPRTAPNDPRGIIIPALVNPLPYYASLVAGVPAVPVIQYELILPPVAVDLSTGGSKISPPPPGRYRVNVLSATGQTWSVPNDLDIVFSRLGGPLEDPTQGAFVTVEDTPLPSGGIEGDVQLTFEPQGEDFSVIVFAFDVNDPPPPLGGGAPVAVQVIRKADFMGPMLASYALGPLATGSYTVRAFLDANDDFTAWFGALNQPNAGDVGGGFINAMGQLQTVMVDAQAGVTSGVPVIISPLATYPVDRPAFTFTGPAPVLAAGTTSVAVSLTALSALNDVIDVQGIFPIQWVDVNGDGRADDINGDGNPDVFPIVVADLLDAEDETHSTLSSRGVRIPGLIDPRQFVGLGFPAADITATATVVTTNSLTVLFPALASSREEGGAIIAPPPGRYRVTLVNPAGQTWSVPNELQTANGTALPDTQSLFLTVPE